MLTYQKTLFASAFAVLALLANAACAPLAGSDASGGGGAPPKPAGGGTALAAVDGLTVKGRAPRTGYERARFGRAWADVDGNGCGTRDDILRRDLTGVRFTDGRCKVASGTLANDPYTGGSLAYVRGRSKVDIDHVVALSDAWQKGAQKWDAGTRLRFANDPLNLLAVDSATNRRKSDGDAATWLPPNKAYRCTYVARQVAVKRKYGVWVTPGEREAMKRVLAKCPEQRLP
ncbi:HNH endonuclease family protein [Streptomyces sp. NPDC057411]|uniref:HNH endonuclease family protein n=1 Tax=unclassified Streptomyces TaxID=2593676 RepID=UPI0036386885